MAACGLQGVCFVFKNGNRQRAFLHTSTLKKTTKK